MLRYLNSYNKSILLDITGFADAFRNKRCICTLYVWLNKERKTWRIINIKADTPKPREDWFILTFFRAYCDSIITTGKILREEAQIYEENYKRSFLEFEDLEALYKRCNYAEWTKNKTITPTKDKDMVVLTNNLDKKFIMGFPFFKWDFVRTTIFTNPEYKLFHDREMQKDKQYSDFLEMNKIHFQSHPLPTPQSAIEYLQKDLKSKNTFVEMGYSLLKLIKSPDENNNPIEYFVLTILDGLIDRDSLGPEFCSLEELLVHYDHVHTSKAVKDGINSWKFAVFEKKKKFYKLPEVIEGSV